MVELGAGGQCAANGWGGIGGGSRGGFARRAHLETRGVRLDERESFQAMCVGTRRSWFSDWYKHWVFVGAGWG